MKDRQNKKMKWKENLGERREKRWITNSVSVASLANENQIHKFIHH